MFVQLEEAVLMPFIDAKTPKGVSDKFPGVKGGEGGGAR